jgi:hypothetical protein
MESFTWQMPPKIIFGPGSGEKAGKGARALAALMLPFFATLLPETRSHTFDGGGPFWEL